MSTSGARVQRRLLRASIQNAAKQLDEFRIDLTKGSNKTFINTYEIRDGVAYIDSINELNSSDDKRYDFTFCVDEKDLDVLRDKVWKVRASSNGKPYSVFASFSRTEKRKLLQEFLTSRDNVEHIDGNVLNNKRSNFRICATEEVSEHDNIDSDENSTEHDFQQDNSDEAIEEQEKRDENKGEEEEEEVEEENDFMPPAKQRKVQIESFELFMFEDGPQIPRKFWNTVQKEFQKSDETKQLYSFSLSESLGKHYSTFPFPKYTRSELFEDVMRLETYPDNCKTKKSIFPHCQFGHIFCKSFMIDAMFETAYRRKNVKPITLSEMWKMANVRQEFCKTALRTSSHLNSRQLLQAISLSHYIPANFSPGVAKCIFDRYVSKGGKVLDFCSGWGGRLLGFWFADNPTHYVGIDPNKRLLSRYTQMIDWLKRHRNKEKTCEFLQFGAETEEALAFYNRNANSFDLIFTSPPYFDREIYDVSDQSQSCNKFTSYNEWLDSFLLQTVKNSLFCLKTDGYLILNVADTARCETLVNDVINFSSTVPALKYVGVLEMTMPRRPNTNGKEKSEPVVIFKKQINI